MLHPGDAFRDLDVSRRRNRIGIIERGALHVSNARQHLLVRVEETGAAVRAEMTAAIGVYRASRFAPAQVFYAHRDFVHEAARIAIADSVLLDHRGFPMLIEMADTMCRTYFGAQTVERPAYAAFANANAPFRHLNERTTRR